MGGEGSDLICGVYTLTSEYRCCLCADRSVLAMSPLKTALRRMAVTVVVRQCKNAFVNCCGGHSSWSSILHHIHQALLERIDFVCYVVRKS